MENRGGLSGRIVRRQEDNVVEPTKRTDLLKLIEERMAQEDGWKLIEDVEPLFDRSQGSIETIGFLQAGEKFIEYKELLDRAKELELTMGDTMRSTCTTIKKNYWQGFPNQSATCSFQVRA